MYGTIDRKQKITIRIGATRFRNIFERKIYMHHINDSIKIKCCELIHHFKKWVISNDSKIKKVFIIVQKNAYWPRLYDQCESIAMRYMNRFAIEEDDQFEIASVQNVKYFFRDDQLYKLDKAMQAVVRLTNQITEG